MTFIGFLFGVVDDYLSNPSCTITGRNLREHTDLHAL